MTNPTFRAKLTGVTIAMALLLQVIFIAVSVSAAPPDHTVSNTQANEIETALGPGAPFGDWQRATENVEFWLHSTQAPVATGSGAQPDPDQNPAVLEMDLVKPSADPNVAPEKVIVVGNNDRTTQYCVQTLLLGRACVAADEQYEQATFTTYGSMAAVDSAQIFDLSGRVYIEGLPTGGLAYAVVNQVDEDGAIVQERGQFTLEASSSPTFDTGATPGPIEYRGSLALGADGFTLPEGHGLQFVIGTATTDASDVVDPQGSAIDDENIRGNLYGFPGLMYLDNADFPSSFSVRADSARINIWTETLDGDVEDVFPAANINEDTPASIVDRQLLVHVMQANAFGANQIDLPNQPDNQGQHGRHTIRLRHMDTGEDMDVTSAFPDFITGAQSTQSNPRSTTMDSVSADGSVRHRVYHYLYPAGFDADDGDPSTPLVPKTQDGRYRIEVFNNNQQWGRMYDYFTIGNRGFSFALAAGEVGTHSTYSGGATGDPEATTFSFVVTNTGSFGDTIGLAVPTSGGWKTTLSTTAVVLQPGESEPVTLTVTPPVTAGGGDSRSFTVTGASIATSDIKGQQVTVNVVDTLTKGVDVIAGKASIETRPGVVDNSFVTLRNTGNAEERFLVRASGAPAGWGVSLSPATKDLLGQSRADLLLQVSAPADAETGTAFVLTITATSVSDATNRDVLTIPVVIFTVNGVQVEPLVRSIVGQSVPGHEMRDDGGNFCGFAVLICVTNVDQDTAHDRSSLVRLRVSNTGDLDNEFKVEAFWNKALGAFDDSSPGGGGDGVPDCWTIDDDAVATPSNLPRDPDTAVTGFSGFYPLTTLDIPAHTTVDYHFTVRALWESSSSSTCKARFAGMTVQVSDVDDPSFVARENMVFNFPASGARAGSNVYANAFHQVGIDTAPNQPTEGYVQPDGSIIYELTAQNHGNEIDTLAIKALDGKPGWAQKIIWDPAANEPNTDLMFNGEDSDADMGLKTIAGCSTEETPSDKRIESMACTMGVYDEVRFKVVITPPAGARFGDTSTHAVQVVSTSDGTKVDELVLDTTVTGTYAYQALAEAGDKDVHPAKGSSFPFSVRNLGTADDTYLLTIIEGDSSWSPSLSESSGEVYVPGLKDWTGFIAVTPPASAAVDDTEHFRVQIENIGDPADPLDNTRQNVDFFATVVADSPDLTMSAAPILIRQGQSGDLIVEAEDLSGDATEITFDAHSGDLPRGWTMSAKSTEVVSLTGGQGQVTYQINAPANALGTSRISLRVTATTDTGDEQFVDAEVRLSSSYALTLDLQEEKQIIVPGETAEHVLVLRNEGLGRDTVDLTTSTPPSGWTFTFSEDAPTLEPLQTKEIIVTVTAPANAAAGATTTVSAFAASINDPGQTDQATLLTEVGVFALTLAGQTEALLAAPEEVIQAVINVTNTGTVRDTVELTASLPPVYNNNVDVQFSDNSLNLAPGESRDVAVTIEMPRVVTADTTITTTFTATSLSNGNVASGTVPAKILRHVQQDVDGDLLPEIAVDRNNDDSDGFEEFIESSQEGGVTVVVPDLVPFLTDDAVEAKTRTVVIDGNDTDVFEYVIDGDEDGRHDFFLDRNQDELPDIYWDPDSFVRHNITATKDVNKDAVRELFIDIDGDRLLDRYFDLAVGEFGDLIQTDIDGDGKTDYVVDLNGNGRADAKEPVFYARTNGLVIVEMADVDGDGQLDQVFDTDGDGVPDYFIPFGKTDSVAIVLRDIDNDGVDEWTYDADGDGKRESFYDPVTGETGMVDSQNAFISALLEYWYVSAIFLLVVALFVVLLIVTRR